MKSLVRIRLFLAVLLVIVVRFSNSFSSNSCWRHRIPSPFSTAPSSLQSSFYGDFEQFDEPEEDDDEDEDDDDDEYEEMDDEAVARFRQQMSSADFGSVDELISFATSKASEEASTDWASPQEKIEPGHVLVANPAKFCDDWKNTGKAPSSSLLSKFGLTLPPPADLGPDRRADLLPVLVILERHPLRGSQAVLLNRRTGYLLGDLEQQTDGPKLGAFMIQPLWFGGTSAGSEDSSGLDMLHLCPAVNGAKQLTPDGLFWGGDPEQAQEAMNDSSLPKPMSGFDFKFFVQSTRWLPLQVCFDIVIC